MICKNKIKKIITSLIAFTLFINSANVSVFATSSETEAEAEIEVEDENSVETDENEEENTIPEVEIGATSAILMDGKSGKVLYDKNANEMIYPASMTKILTALVMLDYIALDEYISIGYEINEISLDSSRAGHEVGEVITGENLLRGLIIPSGNESANVVALNVALRETGRSYLEYSQAETIFMQLMNEKAVELGAVNTHFTTPHGYHDNDHYTTAYDMALITQAAMEYDIIREIAMEIEYTGLSAGDDYKGDGKNVEHTWISHNELIKNNGYYYPYATGLKTGFTSYAGNCLSATATNGDIELIAILSNSGDDPGRWLDATTLFEYGFNNYQYYDILDTETYVTEANVKNAVRGSEGKVQIAPLEDISVLLNEDEFENIIYTVDYLDAYKSNEVDEKGSPILKAPLNKGEIIGTITYTLDKEVIYSGDITPLEQVDARTFKSTFLYYFNQAKSVLLSWYGIPIVISIIAVIYWGFLLIRKIRNGKRKYKKNRKGFKTKY